MLGFTSKLGVSQKSEAWVDRTLASVIKSTVMQLDARDNKSFRGSGEVWANVIVRPADGALKSDYDYYRGIGDRPHRTDPAFAGSVGNSGSYFLLDGGDFFTAKKDMPLGETAWIALKVKPVLADNACLFGGVYTNKKGSLILKQGSKSKVIAPAGSLTGDTCVIVLSWDASSVKCWIDGKLKTTSTRLARPNPACIGANSERKDAMPKGTRYIFFAMGNELLEDDAALRKYII